MVDVLDGAKQNVATIHSIGQLCRAIFGDRPSLLFATPAPGPEAGSLGRGARGGWEGRSDSLGPLTAHLLVTHPAAGPEPSLLEHRPQLGRCCVSRPGLGW